MRKSTLEISRQTIEEFFDQSKQTVYTQSQLATIFRVNRGKWALAQSLLFNNFLTFLTTKSQMSTIAIELPHSALKRYSWRSASIHEIALSLRPDSYLSHYTAMQLHGLASNGPRIIYVNKEQGKKAYGNDLLLQQNIDMAFRNSPRITKNIAQVNGYRIMMLNGMFTNRLGVVELLSPLGELLPVTSLERTLVDISVRPSYAGEVNTVLDAYRKARDKVSVPLLAEMLSNLHYKYPYHQVIGFYLERTGAYSDSEIDLFRCLKTDYDFYLTHDMKMTSYSKTWRLYYPLDLE